jgi:hypothetical protein
MKKESEESVYQLYQSTPAPVLSFLNNKKEGSPQIILLSDVAQTKRGWTQPLFVFCVFGMGHAHTILVCVFGMGHTHPLSGGSRGCIPRKEGLQGNQGSPIQSMEESNAELVLDETSPPVRNPSQTD